MSDTVEHKIIFRDITLSAVHFFAELLPNIYDFLKGPCQKKPILYVRASDYCCTGKKKSGVSEGENRSQYVKAAFSLVDSVPGWRNTRDLRTKVEEWTQERIDRMYPGWNVSTIQYLHRIYRSVKERNQKMNFVCVNGVCRMMGDIWNSTDERREFFQKLDINETDDMSLNMFTHFMFFLNPSEGYQIVGLAEGVVEHVDVMGYMENLPFGEYLEFGLF